ncbi:MAG: phytanoyl-CoA dioxygenase family protein [Chelatococcus sp.]|jgi:ectoine hydroxylase-related dioxygenase (phytanoyl-CoA dioxygenase family)|uniref:phytanoyl-CoA dioxygenase family protein n=1 Tax=unclassified Chelatococcus TaxID=2638111 RepID=UPI001BCBA219|nr:MULTISPECIES: phytanoyl-CoA dioxygenase family protein [unclassified Chelatococcus]CAH1653370.1 Ectoine hydroxylase-related dioxygenase, phytanoyl-CoA dioxygenase (PhyH) family [Hyphomicrobiales bacterium]MBS7742910.1 phytanoyl-CoA dioxygenase family protein [Chelatococcus sp. HY11]MBX3538950.1 phytanoyl-CoA dioxygenase family protein [Chelatococcus sp.]MBX3541972.1 phytanoyl-CoA dioxygenase family protein [Chelatococcus sp.]MCO5074136.1 phytanoyl-CoA dioxygenase family protein [Chelatococc
MTTQFTRPITEDEIRTYEEDGVVCLRNILSTEWVEMLRDAVEDVLNQPGPSGHDIAAGSGGGKFGYDIFMWTFNQRFRQFQAESPMPEWAAALMRSKTVNLAVDAMFVKEPNTTNHTPWHHDQPYLWMDGTQVCSFWTPLDSVTLETGVTEWIPGSHRTGKWYRPTGFDAKKYKDYPDDLFEALPDIEANRSDWNIVHFDMDPGDVLAHHLLTLHHAPGNTSHDRRRRALAFRYAGDDVTYAKRPMGPQPLRDPGLSVGQPLASAMFPQVWPRRPLAAFDDDAQTIGAQAAA